MMCRLKRFQFFDRFQFDGPPVVRCIERDCSNSVFGIYQSVIGNPLLDDETEYWHRLLIDAHVIAMLVGCSFMYLFYCS